MEVRSVEAIVRALNEARVQYLIVKAAGRDKDLLDIEQLKKLDPYR